MDTAFVDEAMPDHRVFGADQTPRIVAIERAGEASVRVFRRDGLAVREQIEPLRPWLVSTSSAEASLGRGASAVPLRGNEPLGVRYSFDSWSQWGDAHRALRDAQLPAISFPSAVEQYLIETGRGLFRGMAFDDLKRAQIDIETLSLDPTSDDAAIVIATGAINGADPVIFRVDQLKEPELIDALTAWIRETDPDVIEGHNLFNFDVLYLVERARRHGRTLAWGRDGSPLRVAGEQRFKAGARSIPYRSAWVHGRHLIDTYQQIQRYDSSGQLDSYALKPVIAALGLARSDREIVEGALIADAWAHDRERLIRYALDDVIDVNALSELALPTEFYQTRVLPRGLQSVATGGPGEKINDLLVRAYVSADESIPLPSPARDYPGGYAAVRAIGRFSPVVKCDAESLYPSIMLADRIAPKADRLGVFQPMLSVLTDRRLQAKRAARQSAASERARWSGIQTSFKVLINSFYGYLGYSRGYFNDYDAAESVTLRGQAIVQAIVAGLEAKGATTIEVDTDGVFFQPPHDVTDEAAEIAIIESVSDGLGAGIRLAHDGRYRGMLSLKLKNYALLEYDGRVILKGSSLRSRREERFLRRFLRDAVARLLEPERHGSIREYYLDIGQQIIDGQLGIDEIARVETITDQTFRSDANRRLADAVEGERVGERVLVYQRADGTLRRASSYAGDEDRAYLLRRLRDMAERFRPLFTTDAEFEHTFPAITPRTDIHALRAAEPVTQLTLFG